MAAYLPNLPETLVLMLATASLGATFSSCAPEFGTRSVIDRWQQIDPDDPGRGRRLPLRRQGRGPSRRRSSPSPPRYRASQPRSGCPTWTPPPAPPPGAIGWDELLAESAPLVFERVPFDHPLYVLFSSGTTGLPKPIVHGHGGITVEHLKSLALRHGPRTAGPVLLVLHHGVDDVESPGLGHRRRVDGRDV
ncbi:MAG: AMP-binding protein [Nocardioidaceae bacterium]